MITYADHLAWVQRVAAEKYSYAKLIYIEGYLYTILLWNQYQIQNWNSRFKLVTYYILEAIAILISLKEKFIKIVIRTSIQYAP